MKIQTKVLLSIALAIGIGLLSVSISLKFIFNLESTLWSLTKQSYPTTSLLTSMKISLLNAHAASLSITNNSSADYSKESEALFWRYFQEHHQYLDSLKKAPSTESILSEDYLQAASHLEELAKRYFESQQSSLNTQAEIAQILDEIKDNQSRISDSFRGIAEQQTEMIYATEDAADRLVSREDSSNQKLKTLIEGFFQNDILLYESSKNLSTEFKSLYLLTGKIAANQTLSQHQEDSESLASVSKNIDNEFRTIERVELKNADSRAALEAVLAGYQALKERLHGEHGLIEKKLRTINSQQRRVQDQRLFFENIQTMTTELESAKASIEAKNARTIQETEQSVSEVTDWVRILSLSLIVVGVFIVMFLAKQVTRPLNSIVSHLLSLYKGDYLFTTQYTGLKGEIGDLARAVEKVREQSKNIQELKDNEEAQNIEIYRMSEKALEADRARLESQEHMFKQLDIALSNLNMAVSNGDFKSRIDEAGFQDNSFLKLAQGVNELIAFVDDGIRQALTTLQHIAKGDLTSPMQGNFRGDLRELQAQTNNTIVSLTALITDIKNSSIVVKDSIAEFESNASSLSESNQVQSDAIHKISDSISRTTACYSQSTKALEAIKSYCDSVNGRADELASNADQTIESMDRVKVLAGQVQQTTSQIQDIAFQTNLLALNAAVEASRHKDGAGFKAVAHQVKELAEKASQSTKEIGSILEQNHQAVTQGTEHFKDFALSIHHINQDINSITSQVSISTATNQEQFAQLKSISFEVEKVEGHVLRTQSTVTNSAETSKRIENEMVSVVSMIGQFKTA